MERDGLRQRLESCDQVLIGLGEEWKLEEGSRKDKDSVLLQAYRGLYELIREKDYFIVTMAEDELIYETVLGSDTELVIPCEAQQAEQISCPSTDEKTMTLIDKLFPPENVRRDTRRQRILAPCAGENTEQQNRYMDWFKRTLGKAVVILELGVGFSDPGIIRFPFEKAAFFNQKAYMLRVNGTLPQIAEELGGRAEGIAQNSVEWIVENSRLMEQK